MNPEAFIAVDHTHYEWALQLPALRGSLVHISYCDTGNIAILTSTSKMPGSHPGTLESAPVNGIAKPRLRGSRLACQSTRPPWTSRRRAASSPVPRASPSSTR